MEKDDSINARFLPPHIKITFKMDKILRHSLPCDLDVKRKFTKLKVNIGEYFDEPPLKKECLKANRANFKKCLNYLLFLM